jgi:hypothetical protein
MTEQAEEATRLSAAFVQASNSAALSGEIAVKNEALAAREAEIARLRQRIAEMDTRAQAAMGRETALQQQLAALYSSTSWRIAAPLRFAKRLLTHFLTFNNRLPLASGPLVSSQRTELLVDDQLDLNAEPDNVRHLYLRLVRTRERISGSR